MLIADFDSLCQELSALGVRDGAVLMVHSSLSAFGDVDGGAQTVTRALLRCVEASGGPPPAEVASLSLLGCGSKDVGGGSGRWR